MHEMYINSGKHGRFRAWTIVKFPDSVERMISLTHLNESIVIDRIDRCAAAALCSGVCGASRGKAQRRAMAASRQRALKQPSGEPSTVGCFCFRDQIHVVRGKVADVGIVAYGAALFAVGIPFVPEASQCTLPIRTTSVVRHGPYIRSVRAQAR